MVLIRRHLFSNTCVWISSEIHRGPIHRMWGKKRRSTDLVFWYPLEKTVHRGEERGGALSISFSWYSVKKPSIVWEARKGALSISFSWCMGRSSHCSVPGRHVEQLGLSACWSAADCELSHNMHGVYSLPWNGINVSVIAESKSLWVANLLFRGTSESCSKPSSILFRVRFIIVISPQRIESSDSPNYSGFVVASLQRYLRRRVALGRFLVEPPLFWHLSRCVTYLRTLEMALLQRRQVSWHGTSARSSAIRSHAWWWESATGCIMAHQNIPSVKDSLNLTAFVRAKELW